MGNDDPEPPAPDSNPDSNPGTSPGLNEVIRRVSAGEEAAAAELFGLLYDELRGMAGRIFSAQRSSHTLQPTALVHEAYLKIIRPGPGDPPAWQDRTHFCRVAARAMRQVLVNHARDRNAQKRGGDHQGARVTLSEAAAPELARDLEILALNDELEKLAELDPRQAQGVELRIFGGLTSKEIAEALGMGLRTVELDWKMAKAWLVTRWQSRDS